MTAETAEHEARVPGTGLEVWEVAKTYLEVGHDWGRLIAAYDGLTEEQLRETLAYVDAHPDAILARIREDYDALPPEYRPSFPLYWR